MSKGQLPEQTPAKGEPPVGGERAGEASVSEVGPGLPPPRSVQSGSALWWWFLVLLALIGVWVVAMLFMRGPIKQSDDGDIILLNPSSSASAAP